MTLAEQDLGQGADELVVRLQALGERPVHPALASAHLTMLGPRQRRARPWLAAAAAGLVVLGTASAAQALGVPVADRVSSAISTVGDAVGIGDPPADTAGTGAGDEPASSGRAPAATTTPASPNAVDHQDEPATAGEATAPTAAATDPSTPASSATPATPATPATGGGSGTPATPAVPATPADPPATSNAGGNGPPAHSNAGGNGNGNSGGNGNNG